MDDDVLTYLMALKKVNEALLEGLKLTIHVLELEKDLSPERRQSNIQTLKIYSNACNFS